MGLEVHAQLLTESKLFAPDPNRFGAAPNGHVGVITLAHPGTLPRLNEKAVELALRFGLATGATISRYTYFDRKNYFYPDLPKGYQTSQDKHPICRGGHIVISDKNGGEKAIPLHHTHLEEDAGKSIHEGDGPDTRLDFNRAGTPLIEIVTDPSLHSAEEAGALLSEVRRLVRHLGICDGNMEEGSLRCDANISVRPHGSPTLGTKVEIKNMNSVRFLQKAILYEFERQVAALDRGEPIVQETRTFDPATGRTFSMRVKETMNDYRYFPEPDLQPLVISDARLEALRQALPELPRPLAARLQALGLPEADALTLTDEPDLRAWFEALLAAGQPPRPAANWLMGPVRAWLNETKKPLAAFPLGPTTLAAVMALVENHTLSHTAATQQLWPALLARPDADPLQLAESLHLTRQGNSDELAALIEAVLAAFPEKVKEYRKGKKGLLGLFVGEVMKKTAGRADPKLINELIIKQLNTFPS